MIALLFLATCFLAYSNGANDNFKGVALLGWSRPPVIVPDLLGHVTSLLAPSCNIFFAQALLKKFPVKGCGPNRLSLRVFSVVGRNRAGLTVIVATLTGFGFHDARIDRRHYRSGLAAVGTEVNFQSWARAS